MLTTISFHPAATHHPKFWISDGNVVLSAVSMDKEQTVLFRIHKSMLSDQSEVFASMFALSQTQDDGGIIADLETYEGLPLVRLHDAAEDLDALLNALQDTSPLSELSTISDTPLRVRPALRLASKYLMNDLRGRLVHIVELMWPRTLEDLESKTMLYDGVRKIEKGGEKWPWVFLPEPIASINLAEEFDIPSILPAAYYHLLRCSPSADWDTVQKLGFKTLRNKVPARWPQLTHSSSHKLLKLREVLDDSVGYWTTYLHHNRAADCDNQKPKVCKELWVSIQKGGKERRRSVLTSRDPLLVLTKTHEELEESELCYGCFDVVERNSRRIRDDIWNTLCSISCPKSRI
ncbi:hypothetical protein SCHPADRAFT_940240 [Schizopora paradoxa]|uniref:BTB domain-containing protein n=1 Tax=Schizopora paradoxa TaxID=27342 RepID=A0A0H2RNN1_9AGAM|nr:hypothetical protein SCHPADRAFT_940240 [Schizopora paradoxa]